MAFQYLIAHIVHIWIDVIKASLFNTVHYIPRRILCFSLTYEQASSSQQGKTQKYAAIWSAYFCRVIDVLTNWPEGEIVEISIQSQLYSSPARTSSGGLYIQTNKAIVCI